MSSGLVTRRTCIVVLGMHRSGTSALTRVISLMGAELPRNVLGPNPTNPAGHWEPIRLVELHDRMLAEAGSRWDDWRPFDHTELSKTSADRYRGEIASIIHDEFGAAPLFVLKDPRIARFAGLYADILEAMGIDVRYVHMSRNPLEVTESLERRDRFTPAYAGLLWLRHELDAERSTRGARRVFVSYEDLVSDWSAVAEKIGAVLGIEWPRGAWEANADIASFIAPEHRHHRVSDLLVTTDRRVNRWVRQAYQSLKALRANPDDSQALTSIDHIGEQFDSAAHDVGAAFFHELDRRQGLLLDAERHWKNIAEHRGGELAQLAATSQANAATEAAHWQEMLAKRDTELSAAVAAERHWRDAAERLQTDVERAQRALADASASLETERENTAAQHAAMAQRIDQVQLHLDESCKAQALLSTEMAAAKGHFEEQLAGKDRLLETALRLEEDARTRGYALADQLAFAANAEAERQEKLSMAEHEATRLRHRLAETEAAMADLAGQIERVRNSRLWKTATSLKIWAKGSPSVPLPEPQIQQAADASTRYPEEEGDPGTSRIGVENHQSHHADR